MTKNNNTGNHNFGLSIHKLSIVSTGVNHISSKSFFLVMQIAEIPKLTSGCTEFIESAEQILEKRKMNQTLLSNHSTLLDLLEIPQLMDTYVFDNVVMVICKILINANLLKV